MEQSNINSVIEILEELYKGAKCGLNFDSPYELLISTILSAQCTDERVNLVCSNLYPEYNTPNKIISLTEQELSEKIKSCGLYKTKSKNIIATTRLILEEFNGLVPDNMEDLLKLPGVGRKTANVVLSNAYNIPAIAVDTHVFRVSRRLGLSKADKVEIVEKDLMNKLPKDKWSDMHHYIIWHGRKVCKARKPLCNECKLSKLCLYYKDIEKK